MGEPIVEDLHTGSPVVIHGLEGLQERAGTEVGVSSWRTVRQEDIDTFAKLTGDEQWIHVDPERAKSGPFGTTVQHGFLTLGLATGLLWEVCTVDGFGVVLNYGLNKVRFPAPLQVGSRIRMHVDRRRGASRSRAGRQGRRGGLPADLRGRGRGEAVLRGRSRLPLLRLNASHCRRHPTSPTRTERWSTNDNDRAARDRPERRGQRHPHQLPGGRLRRRDVVLVHGSGPGVTSYANWRLVHPRARPRTSTSSRPTWSASASPTARRASSTAWTPGPTRPSA